MSFPRSTNRLSFPNSPQTKLRFRGSLEALEARLNPLGLGGEWTPKPNGVWILRCEDGSGLSWSETRGTVWFDGPPFAKARLEKKVRPALNHDVAEINDASNST